MNILATICARGGSKGVKGKNIKLLAGKPLIAYTIEKALACERVSDVVVSTDSDEIANIARQHGAKVPFMRPGKLALDTSPKMPVIRHSLKECERIFDKQYDVVVDLDPTSPIRRLLDIENAYQKFMREETQTLFSAVKARKNPYFNMVELDKEANVTLCKTLPAPIYRRQDAPRVYDMNASIYFFRREFLLDGGKDTIFLDPTSIYIMDDISAFDIDREVDFKFVEFLIKEGVLGEEYL